MTKIITVLTRKGGSGKTTIVTNLSVESAKKKLTTLIIDCDYETKVASKWFHVRDNDQLSDFLFCIDAYKTSDIKELVATAKKNKVSYVFIDTPGTNDNLVNEAVIHSDFCIIPCGAGGFDILQIRETVDLVNRLNKKSSFVITKSIMSSNEEKDTRNILHGFGINTYKKSLTNLKLYRDAAVLGKSVSECNINSKPSAEIKDLFRWLNHQLKESPFQEKFKRVKNEQKK